MIEMPEELENASDLFLVLLVRDKAAFVRGGRPRELTAKIRLAIGLTLEFPLKDEQLMAPQETDPFLGHWK